MPTLEITTMIGCPLKCTFCPQDTLRAKYGKQEKYLSLDNFKLILSKVPTYVRIDFAGMAEPWANGDATAMLLHTLERGYNVAIYTTLYGMKAADVPEIVEALARHSRQVEVICIHLPDGTGNMRGFKPTAEYRNALSAFLQLKSTKLFRDFHVMTMNGAGEVHPELREMVSVPGGWVANTRAGTVARPEGEAAPMETMPCHAAPVTCAYTPFYDQNVVLPNGDVVICCMDYSTKHIVGNLISGDYASIFASPGMGALRAANASFTTGDSICKNCTRAVAYNVANQNRQFWRVTPYAESQFRKVAARHSAWTSALLLSNVDDVILHEEHQSRGRYVIEGRTLKVAWDQFPAETYVEMDGVYTHLGLIDAATPAPAPMQAAE